MPPLPKPPNNRIKNGRSVIIATKPGRKSGRGLERGAAQSTIIEDNRWDMMEGDGF